MRTRRSWRNQDRLWRALGAEGIADPKPPQPAIRRCWDCRNYPPGGRNRYIVERAGALISQLEEMARQGLVSRGRTTERLACFHATQAGCQAIGLTQEQIDRAFDCRGRSEK